MAVKNRLLNCWRGDLDGVRALVGQIIQAEEKEVIIELIIESTGCLAISKGHLPIMRYLLTTYESIIISTEFSVILSLKAERFEELGMDT